MNGLKRAGRIIVNVILWVLIIVIAFFAVVTFSQKGNGQVMRLFGYTPMTVLSDSMAPTFHKNDLILVRQDNPATYQEGDIISFWTVIDGQKVINTHRILSATHEGSMSQFITKGDANSAADTYVVSGSDVIGKYALSIPLLGSVLHLLSSSTGFLVVIVLPLLAFFLYQLYRLIMLLVELKRQTVIEATRAAMEQLEQEKQAKQENPETQDPPEAP